MEAFQTVNTEFTPWKRIATVVNVGYAFKFKGKTELLLKAKFVKIIFF